MDKALADMAAEDFCVKHALMALSDGSSLACGIACTFLGTSAVKVDGGVTVVERLSSVSLNDRLDGLLKKKEVNCAHIFMVLLHSHVLGEVLERLYERCEHNVIQLQLVVLALMSGVVDVDALRMIVDGEKSPGEFVKLSVSAVASLNEMEVDLDDGMPAGYKNPEALKGLANDMLAEVGYCFEEDDEDMI